MKCLIIYRVNAGDISNSGVISKMWAQAEGLRYHNYEVDVCYHDEGHIYVNKETIDNVNIHSYFNKAWFNIQGFFSLLTKKIAFEQYDLIYIRYPMSAPAFIKFIKKAGKQGNSVLIEMPTYPYKREFAGINRSILLIDYLYQSQLKKYVEGIIHFGKAKRLLGIPVVPLSNGIGVDKIVLSKSVRKNKVIRLIAIGKWQTWHGLDRLIKGLANYYNGQELSYDIFLTVVGEGNAKKDLQRMTDENPILQRKVFFTGNRTGQSLDALFDEADIGIGTLGIHRKKVDYNSSLKHREYCSRGLPFVLSTSDSDFPEDLSFVKYFPEDESAVKMADIIALYEGTSEIKSTIRLYAEERLSWRSKMKEIVGDKSFY